MDCVFQFYSCLESHGQLLPGWMDKSTLDNEKGCKAFRDRNAFNLYAPALWDLDKMSPTDA